MKDLRFVSLFFALGLVAACELTPALDFAGSCPPLDQRCCPGGASTCSLEEMRAAGICQMEESSQYYDPKLSRCLDAMQCRLSAQNTYTCTSKCDYNLVQCLSSCIDPQSDINNCGGCTASGQGQRCDSGYLCVAGVCALTCPSTMQICGEQCIDPQSDANNCGGCTASGQGVQCKGKTDTCNSGLCLCGTQQPCPAHLQCASGQCVPISCLRDEDCASGFCDSALGYQCSVRCTADTDCKNTDAIDGEFCRKDGRCASKVFETVWNITDDKRTLTLPRTSTTVCNFKVLWGAVYPQGDWSKAQTVTDCSKATHTYYSSAIITIKIAGIYDGFGMDYNTSGTCPANNNPALLAVIRFGPVGLAPCAFAHNSISLANYDIPDATKLTSMQGLFDSATAFNQAIGHWDTSHVTNMQSMFNGNMVFN